MRILVILNGSNAGYSGGDLHTIAVVNMWARAHTVTLLLPAGSSREVRQLVDPRVEVRGRGAPGRPIGRGHLLVRYITRTVYASAVVLKDSKRWDVIVASSHYLFDLLPTMLCRRSHRVLYWHHHAEVLPHRPMWVRALVTLSERSSTLLLARTTNTVFTSNSQTLKFLLSHGLSEEQVVLTQSGPSLAFTGERDPNPVEVVASASTSHRTVLFCGRLSRLKGTSDIAIIAPILTGSPHNARLVLIGQDGDGAETLKRALAYETAEGRVIFTGFLDEGAKARLFREAHVLVSPSYEEGWSITVGDGLAAGCWVVAYDIPAVHEAFPAGPRYVPVGDCRALISEVLRCLAEPRPDRPFVPASWEDIAEREMNAICRS